MTENLAGRGEGPAGLVAKFKHLAENVLMRYASNPQYAAEIFHTEDTYHDLLGLCAALEAAAPAGTAPPRQVTSDCLDQLREILDRKDLSGADLYALNEATAALATASPQAPRPDCELLSSPNSVLAFDDELNPEQEQEQCNAFSTTSAWEQSSATASGNLSMADGSVERGPNLAIFREVLRLHSSWVHFPEDGHLECVCHETICKTFRIRHRETVDAWLDHVMPLLFPGGAA